MKADDVVELRVLKSRLSRTYKILELCKEDRRRFTYFGRFVGFAPQRESLVSRGWLQGALEMRAFELENLIVLRIGILEEVEQ